MSFGSTVFFMVGKVENTVDIIALIINLIDNEIFGLDTVDPFGHIFQGKSLRLSGLGVHHQNARCLRKAKPTGVFVGGNNPIGFSGIVEFKGCLLYTSILVVRDGDIVERGSHVELLAKNGFYAGLYNSQFEAKVS